MKNQIVFYIFLFFIILSPAFGDLVPKNEIDNMAPPEWIFGAWTLEEETDEPFIIIFTEDNIIMDNYSLAEDIESGYVILFEQEITEEYYEIFVKFENDDWFKERFLKTSADSMESQFTASDGTEMSFTYNKD